MSIRVDKKKKQEMWKKMEKELTFSSFGCIFD
jgi:hypothetical protein